MSDLEHDEDLKPKFFMTPNIYVDVLMPLLTPEEFMVLMFAVRRTLGFHKRQDRISLSQFCTGTVKYGEAKDDGTGLSVNSVRNALKKLEQYKILTKVEDNNPLTNEGSLYEIQFSSKVIEWNELEKRYDEWRAASAKRVAKGVETRRRMNPLSYDDTGGVSSDDTPQNDQISDQKNDSDSDLGGSSDDRGGDRRTITQNTVEKQLIGNTNTSMHGVDSEKSTNQLTQSGMDECMDVVDQEKYDFLWDCGLRSPALINKMLVLSMQSLEKEWAIVKNSTTIKDIPGALGRNLKAALHKHEMQQRQAAQRAANPEPAQPKPLIICPEAEACERPEWITLEEWASWYFVPNIYGYLHQATLTPNGLIECINEELTADFYDRFDWTPQYFKAICDITGEAYVAPNQQ